MMEIIQGGAVGRRSWLSVQRWRTLARRGSSGARLDARARVERSRGVGSEVWKVGLRVVV